MPTKSLLKKTPYCAAADNDLGVRPRIGQYYAPRQISVACKDNRVWMSWIHYHGENDFPVVTSKKPGQKRSSLVYLSRKKKRIYSKPVFFNNADRPVSIFFAQTDHKQTCICEYRRSSGSWKCVARIPTVCTSIYHMDVIGCQGNIWLVYSGTVSNETGLYIFSRKCTKDRWSGELKHPVNGSSVNRPKLAVCNAGVMIAADSWCNGKFSLVWKP